MGATYREIDGESFLQDTKEAVSATIDTYAATDGTRPGLGVVLVGDDPASETYVSLKEDDCADVGIAFERYELPYDTPEYEVVETIDRATEEQDGVIIQFPMPDRYDADRLVHEVPPEQDVDGLSTWNQGSTVTERDGYVPCTAQSIVELLDGEAVDVQGKDVTIINNTNRIGNPLSNLLSQQGATVTRCNEYTDDLTPYTRQADILVSAAGVPHLIDDPDQVRDGVIAFDAGFAREDGELYGDIDKDALAAKLEAATPTTGGVGPATRAMLLENTVHAWQEQQTMEEERPYLGAGARYPPHLM